MTAMNVVPGKIAAAAVMSALPSGSGPGGYEKYGMVMRFKVQIKGSVDLGRWSSCTGLSIVFKPDDTLKPGGQYEHQWFLPGEVNYGEVTLERAMEKTDSGKVRSWLRKVVAEWINWDGAKPAYQGETVSITLFDSQGAKEVSTWDLRNAIPKSWTGPNLTGKGNDVAIEKLVLVHQGFL